MSSPFSVFFPVAQGIAALFAPYVEVVIHDLETQSVVFLENNFSKRHIGSPSQLSNDDFKQDVLGPYEKMNWDGRKLKSISMVLRNPQQTPIGLLCLNMDISHFEKIEQFIQPFLNQSYLTQQPESLFKEDWQERINTFIQRTVQNNKWSLQALNRKQKKALVHSLYQEGAFKAKGTVQYVSDVIGLSRPAVYKYLNEFKELDFGHLPNCHPERSRRGF